MAYLERRECEYDGKTLVIFYKEGESVQPFVAGVIVFTSIPDKIRNKYYLGPAPLEHMATQIATTFGPCGNNRDYLFLLEKAMFDIGMITQVISSHLERYLQMNFIEKIYFLSLLSALLSWEEGKKATDCLRIALKEYNLKFGTMILIWHRFKHCLSSRNCKKRFASQICQQSFSPF